MSNIFVAWLCIKYMVLVQVVTITESDTAKEQWLMSNMADFIDKGDVLVFANQKARVDIVSDKLKVAGYKYVPNQTTQFSSGAAAS